MERRPLLADRAAGLGLLLALALVPGCRTTEEKRPAASDPPIVWRADPRRAWDVASGASVLGSVVYFAADAAPDRSVYVVRNAWGQDMGWVDHLGRAYRLLPHHKEPAWVGTGTVLQGVARILRAEEPCRLVERPLEGEQAGDVPAAPPPS